MLDRLANRCIAAPMRNLAKPLAEAGCHPDHFTLAGFLCGLASLPLLATEHYLLALLAILLNRLCDGLDGAIARLGQPSDAGGFLDITLDFIFYAMVPFGFILANPADNAIAGAALILTFVATGTSFLAFAIAADKHHIQNPDYPNKSFYYMGGLAEGSETLICFIAFCLWPQAFSIIAWIYAAICLITAGVRIVAGYRTLQSVKNDTAATSSR